MKDDKHIITEIENGNKNSFEELYNKYYNAIKYSIIKIMRNNDVHTAELITDRTMEKLYEKIESDGEDLKKRTKNGLYNYLYTTAKNRLIDENRSKSNRVCSLESDITEFGEHDEDNGSPESGNNKTSVLEVDDERPNPLEKMISDSDYKRIREAVKSLKNEKVKKIMIMRFFKGMKYEEIAETENISMGTVKGSINKGKKVLKEAIKAL